MATKEKARNILNFFLNDIAEIFPFLFIFYATVFILSLAFESWQWYFNWPIFHVNILILGLLSFLSESGREKVFSLIHSGKIKLIKLKKATFKATAKSLLSFIVKIFAAALGIRQRGIKSYLKFVLLAIVLSFAISRGANVIELLILFYAFRAIFVGINSRLSGLLAAAFLAGSIGLTIIKKNVWAEQPMIFAFYFFIIFIISQIVESREVRRGKKS